MVEPMTDYTELKRLAEGVIAAKKECFPEPIDETHSSAWRRTRYDEALTLFRKQVNPQTIIGLVDRVKALENACLEAMGWNWMDEDAPDDIGLKIMKVIEND